MHLNQVSMNEQEYLTFYFGKANLFVESEETAWKVLHFSTLVFVVG